MQKLRWFIYKYAHIRGATKYAQPCRFKYAEMNDAANMQVFMKSVRLFRVRFFHIGNKLTFRRDDRGEVNEVRWYESYLRFSESTSLAGLPAVLEILEMFLENKICPGIFGLQKCPGNVLEEREKIWNLLKCSGTLELKENKKPGMDDADPRL